MTSEVVNLLLKSNDRLVAYVERLKENKKLSVETGDIVEEIKGVIIKGEDLKSQNYIAEQTLDNDFCSSSSEESGKIGGFLIQEQYIKPDQLNKAIDSQNKKIGEILIDQNAINKEKLDAGLKKQAEFFNKGGKKTEEYIRLPLGSGHK